MADDTLTSSALSAFFSVVSDSSKNDQQTAETHQAEVVRFDQNGLAWCKVKDSDVALTPVENMTTMVKVGDIIDVSIENGIATGKPSVMTQTVTMDYANAMMMALAGDASLLEQYSSHGIFQDITAQKASFGSLEAQDADIENAYIENAKINKAIIESLEATTGNFKQLQSNDLAVKRFSAQQLTAAKAFITSLVANNAIIESLQARNATIIDLLVEQANINKLVTGEATVQSLIAGSVDAKYVRADRANIDEAWVKELMGMSAWFTSDVTVTGDQSITGQLKSVLIDGDTARFRNIYADALKILGEDGLYHRLNFMNYDESVEYFSQEPSGDEDPSRFGWYEYVPITGTRWATEIVGTDDTVVDVGKTYYEDVPAEYEKVNVSELDGTENPSELGWYERKVENYTSTTMGNYTVERYFETDDTTINHNYYPSLDPDNPSFVVGNTTGYFRKTADAHKEQVYPDGTENPNQLGWYESRYIESYVLSEDESIDASKEYCVLVPAQYEVLTYEEASESLSEGEDLYTWSSSENEYVRWNADSLFSGDTYYKQISEEHYEPVYPNGTENPSALGWYEHAYQEETYYTGEYEYVKTTDTQVVEGKNYYSRGYADSSTSEYRSAYGDSLDNALHGSNIIAETVTATQIDASSVRAALLEAAEIQVGSYATPHIRMYEGNLGFYPGSTMQFQEIQKYEPVDSSTLSGNEVPSQERWYERFGGDDEMLSEPGGYSYDYENSTVTLLVDPVSDTNIVLNGYVMYPVSIGMYSTEDTINFNKTFVAGKASYSNVYHGQGEVYLKITYDGDKTFVLEDKIQNIFDKGVYSISCYSQPRYVRTEDSTLDLNKEYYKLTSEYLHGSPRSRRWYERDDEVGYFRTVDIEPNPNKVYYDGIEASVAYVTNQELYIPRAVVTDKMAVGTPENGEWVWEVSDNQNLSLTWGGRYGGVS